MGFNNGYDSGYYDAKAEFAVERARLEKRIAELEAAGSSSSGGGGGGGGTVRWRNVVYEDPDGRFSLDRPIFNGAPAEVSINVSAEPFGDGDTIYKVTVAIDEMVNAGAVGDVWLLGWGSDNNTLPSDGAIVAFTYGGSVLPWSWPNGSTADMSGLDEWMPLGTWPDALVVVKTPSGPAVYLTYP